MSINSVRILFSPQIGISFVYNFTRCKIFLCSIWEEEILRVKKTFQVLKTWKFKTNEKNFPANKTLRVKKTFQVLKTWKV